jgi:hypothetical protein
MPDVNAKAAACTILYEKLNPSQREIRLMKIKPAETDDVLEQLICTLVKDSLLQLKHRYVALSYVWGDAAGDVEPIVIDGHQVNATRNLVDFLKRCREYTKLCPDVDWLCMYLWVDAICINQKDLSERSDQVTQMASIYRSAHMTMSWLGIAADDSDYAIGNILAMSKKIQECQENGDTRRSDPLSWMKPEQIEWWQPNQDAGSTNPDSNRFWTSLTNLLARAYWRRAWVTQEIVLSKNVFAMCGESFFPLLRVWHIVGWLRTINGRPSPIRERESVETTIQRDKQAVIKARGGAKHLELSLLSKKLRKQVEAGEIKTPLAWRRLILETRTQQATDPRDKLYSVLGLLDSGLRPEYSLPVESVSFLNSQRTVSWPRAASIRLFTSRDMDCSRELPRIQRTHCLFLRGRRTGTCFPKSQIGRSCTKKRQDELRAAGPTETVSP